MIILMKKDSSESQLKLVLEALNKDGLSYDVIPGRTKKMIYVLGDLKKLKTNVCLLAGVDRYIDLSAKRRIIGLSGSKERTAVCVEEEKIGAGKVAMIAGPCAVESYDQILKTAKFISKKGVKFLRGGAYKPRTSPYSFQGLGAEGLKMMRSAADETGLKVVSEVTSEKYLENCLNYCDVVQVGTRNMQNFELLKEIGKAKVPVILKRGYCATIEEWLNSAEYIVSEGNGNVILCERGIRTFECATRYTLDIAAIPVVKKKCNLPIIVDPSHAAGRAEYVKPLAQAAVCAGADGLMVEVHPDVRFAMSDCVQQLNFDQYSELFDSVECIAKAIKQSI